jgi:hypothetical protein
MINGAIFPTFNSSAKWIFQMFKKRIIFCSDSQTVCRDTLEDLLYRENCQIFLFKLSKFFFFKLSKISFPNCQNFHFQTVKIFLFQTVKSMKTNWLLCREISDYGLVCRGSTSLENAGLLD